MINRHRAVDLLVQLKFLHSICKKKFCGRGLSRVSPESCFIQLSDLVVKNKHIMSFMIRHPCTSHHPVGASFQYSNTSHAILRCTGWRPCRPAMAAPCCQINWCRWSLLGPTLMASLQVALLEGDSLVSLCRGAVVR